MTERLQLLHGELSRRRQLDRLRCHGSLDWLCEKAQVRFWSYVRRGESCWEWAGYKTGGYGLMPVHGERTYAHRLAWMIAHGPIPDDLYVCHRCDTRACVNPEHLFLGTCADNLADMRRKGREAPLPRPAGATHHMATLSDAQIASIRTRVKAGESRRSLAKEFGVNRRTVSLWVNNVYRKGSS